MLVVRVAARFHADAAEQHGARGGIHVQHLGDVALARGDRVLRLAGGEVVEVSAEDVGLELARDAGVKRDRLGEAATAGGGTAATRSEVLPQALLFVAGFSILFVVLGTSIGLALRRDRFLLPWWIAGGVLLYWSQAVSVESLYPTQAEFDAAGIPVDIQVEAQAS